MWRCGYVDMWICGYVDMWICGYVDMWICGYVDMWICGYVDLWICGFVDGLWILGWIVDDVDVDDVDCVDSWMWMRLFYAFLYYNNTNFIYFSLFVGP